MNPPKWRQPDLEVVGAEGEPEAVEEAVEEAETNEGEVTREAKTSVTKTTLLQEPVNYTKSSGNPRGVVLTDIHAHGETMKAQDQSIIEI